MADVAQTFAPNPYAAEEAKIERQRKFAELLQSQGLAPSEKFSYNGIEAPVSPAGGLAKALQLGLSGYIQGSSERKADTLSKLSESDRSAAMSALLEGMKPQAAVPGTTEVPGQATVTQADVEDRQKGIDLGNAVAPLTVGDKQPTLGGFGEGDTVGVPGGIGAVAAKPGGYMGAIGALTNLKSQDASGNERANPQAVQMAQMLQLHALENQMKPDEFKSSPGGIFNARTGNIVPGTIPAFQRGQAEYLQLVTALKTATPAEAEDIRARINHLTEFAPQHQSEALDIANKLATMSPDDPRRGPLEDRQNKLNTIPSRTSEAERIAAMLADDSVSDETKALLQSRYDKLVNIPATAAANKPVSFRTSEGKPINATYNTKDGTYTYTAEDGSKQPVPSDATPLGKTSAPFVPESQMESQAQAIADYRSPAPTSGRSSGFNNPALMARVREINPDFNQGEYANINKAMTAWNTGLQGRQITAMGTVGAHIQTVEDLAGQLKNRDFRAYNALANAISKQSGGPEVTNFEVATKVLGTEIAKFLTQSGAGSVREREDFANKFASASSPEQIIGIGQTVKTMLGAHALNLEAAFKASTHRSASDFRNRLGPGAQYIYDAASPPPSPTAAAAPSAPQPQSYGSQPPAAPANPPATGPAYQEGQTATGPGGAKMIYRNGNWQTM